MLTQYPKASWEPKEANECEYFYDSTIPDKYIRFIENLCRQPEGFNPGAPITVLDWQRAIIEPLLGTLRWSDEHKQYVRQYVDVFIGIAKKNGKTTIIAALCLALLVLESPKERQDIVVVAADKDQASILFDAAVAMIEMQPKFEKKFNIKAAERIIVHLKSKGKIRVKASDNPKGLYGPKPTVVIIDELVSQRSDDIYRTLHSSMPGKKEPIFIAITTAGYKNESPFAYEIWQDAKKTLADPLLNTRQLVWINEFPENADPADRNLWRLYNPSIGITKSMEGLELLYNEALRRPTAMPEFRAFQLNQWVEAGKTWIPNHIWLNSGGHANVFDEEMLRGRRAYIGLDLSHGIDFSSESVVLPGSPTNQDVEGWTVLVRSWVSEDSVNARKDYLKRDIHNWADLSGKTNGKWLNIIEGSDIRIKANIFPQILADYDFFDVQEIGADAYMANLLAEELENVGIEPRKVVQSFKNLSDPMKEFETAVMNRRLWHGNNPVFSWHVGNVVPQVNTNAEMKPNKNKKKEAIDGVAATLNALHVAMMLEPEKQFEPVRFINFYDD